MRLMDNMAIVTCRSDGIHVIDVTDPSRPELRGVYPPDDGEEMEAMGLDLQGDTLFVANGSQGFLVLSLQDPDNPRFIARTSGVGPAWGVDVEGEYAYLASLHRGLEIVRVSDLPELERVAQLPLEVFSEDVRVTSSYAYLADYYGLATVEITDPESPVYRDYDETRGRALDLFIDYPFIYLADDFIGIHVFRIDITPADPESISSFDTDDDARGISAADDIAVVADDYNGMLFIDVSDPELPELAGIYPSAGEVRGGLITADIAYVAQGSEGISIINVMDPKQPTVIGTYDDNVVFFHTADIKDSILVVANDQGGVLTVDVSNPSYPRFLGQVATGREVRQVEIQGDVAYVTDGDFHAVDISDPSVPEIVSSYITSTYSKDVAVAGNLAFVANREEGVLCFDIMDPGDSLRRLSRLDTPDFAVAVDVDGSHLYIADDDGGFRVASFDATGQMEEVSSLSLGDKVIDVAISDGIAYLTLNRGAVVAVDVSHAGTPEELDRFSTPGYGSVASVAVEATPSLIFVADISSSIFLGFSPVSGIDTDPSETPGVPGLSYYLRQNYPNPFNPSTAITFHVPVRGERFGNNISVSLDIYSVRGRRVKGLFQGIVGEGEHVVWWDGTNDGGEAVSSGIYLYVLKTGDVNIARKMLLVR
jgi:hypothetical protein